MIVLPMRKARGVIISVALAILLSSGCRRHAVTTYHYDNFRSGWNSNEDKLTPSKVGSPAFGLLHSVALDEQVDTQPLVVPDVKISGGTDPGKHEVVYVATENNTVYAINASNGAILLSRNLGSFAGPARVRGNESAMARVAVAEAVVTSYLSSTCLLMRMPNWRDVPS